MSAEGELSNRARGRRGLGSKSHLLENVGIKMHTFMCVSSRDVELSLILRPHYVTYFEKLNAAVRRISHLNRIAAVSRILTKYRHLHMPSLITKTKICGTRCCELITNQRFRRSSKEVPLRERLKAVGG